MRRSPKPGSLDRDGLEGAADLVHDQGREGLAVDVLGDDQQRLAGLHDLLEHGQEVLDVGDLLVGDQDVGVVEDGLHPLGVGHEVRRDVALVEAHPLGELEVEPEGVGLLDGDDAFLADLVHRLGDGVADGGVATGGDRRGGRDLLAGLDVLGHPEQLLGDGLDGLLDAALEGQRVGARGDVAQALADHGLGQDGGRRRAVTGDVVGLLGNFLDELGPDLLVRVLELDLLGDAHTIVGDGGRTPLLLQNDVAALGAQRDLDRVGEGVHTPLQPAAGLLVESNQLRHGCGDSSRSSDDGWVCTGCALVVTLTWRVPTAFLALAPYECKRSVSRGACREAQAAELRRDPLFVPACALSSASSASSASLRHCALTSGRSHGSSTTTLGSLRRAARPRARTPRVEAAQIGGPRDDHAECDVVHVRHSPPPHTPHLPTTSSSQPLTLSLLYTPCACQQLDPGDSSLSPPPRDT